MAHQHLPRKRLELSRSPRSCTQPVAHIPHQSVNPSAVSTRRAVFAAPPSRTSRYRAACSTSSCVFHASTRFSFTSSPRGQPLVRLVDMDDCIIRQEPPIGVPPRQRHRSDKRGVHSMPHVGRLVPLPDPTQAWRRVPIGLFPLHEVSSPTFHRVLVVLVSHFFTHADASHDIALVSFYFPLLSCCPMQRRLHPHTFSSRQRPKGHLPLVHKF